MLVILAAQVMDAFGSDSEAIPVPGGFTNVATTNVAHITPFVRADLWQNIG